MVAAWIMLCMRPAMYIPFLTRNINSSFCYFDDLQPAATILVCP